YQKSSSFSSFLHGQEGQSAAGNWPIVDFQYFVRFNFNSVLKPFIEGYIQQQNGDLSFLQFLVKSVNVPAVRVNSEILNQYNRKVISQDRIEFRPLTMSLFDVADGKTQKLWE